MMSTRARSAFLVSLAGVALAAVAATEFASPPAASAGDGGRPTEPAGAATPETKRALRRTPVVEAVEKASPAVVLIGTKELVPVRYFDWDFLELRQKNEERKGLGSGVIVHPSGLVVTNAHVINRADQVVVRLTGVAKDAPEIPATILAVDLAHDLALVRLDRPGPYPTVTIGRADDLMPGESVIAIGSPFGFGSTVSTGIVSALDRSIDIRDRRFEGLIQTDAAVNQGNSGGALLNILGEWIGVNSAIYSLSGGADGISFAIPIETVNAFLSRSVQSGRVLGQWLGLDVATDDTGAVRVAAVYPVGPAADAKVPEGARIVEIGGRSLAAGAGLGDATLAVVDASKNGAVDLTLETADGRRRIRVPFAAPPTERLAWQRLGIRATEVTPDVRAKTNYPAGSGILVTEVRDGSPAARVGLQPGDLLVAFGEQALTVEEDLLGFVQTAPKNEVTQVTLVRPERTRFGMRLERYKAKLQVE